VRPTLLPLEVLSPAAARLVIVNPTTTVIDHAFELPLARDLLSLVRIDAVFLTVAGRGETRGRGRRAVLATGLRRTSERQRVDPQAAGRCADSRSDLGADRGKRSSTPVRSR